MYKVAICSDNLVIGHDFHIVKLKHPKGGNPAQFAFAQDYKAIYEVLQHQPEFGSWFIGSEVSSDGSLLYITKFDPVFLAIPYLSKQHKVAPERFSPLEQIFDDEEYPHTRKICRCSTLSSLEILADFKGADDYKAYRYNEDKTLKWLEKKVNKLAAHLEDSNAHVTTGAQSSCFVRSKHTDHHKDDYKLYSFGMVSDYLSAELTEALREHLGLPKEVKQVEEEPPLKKSKASSGSGGPLEDYTKGVLTEKQTMPDKKPSANQKKLDKIDKTGMRSLTSFFTMKPKKSS